KLVVPLNSDQGFNDEGCLEVVGRRAVDARRGTGEVDVGRLSLHVALGVAPQDRAAHSVHQVDAAVAGARRATQEARRDTEAVERELAEGAGPEDFGRRNLAVDLDALASLERRIPCAQEAREL